VSFLLDTNVVSEWVKPQPHVHVVSWLTEVSEGRVFMSVVSFAEIRRGVELMATSAPGNGAHNSYGVRRAGIGDGAAQATWD
jgi:predicted nucleic acid-binding protein